MSTRRWHEGPRRATVTLTLLALTSATLMMASIHALADAGPQLTFDPTILNLGYVDAVGTVSGLVQVVNTGTSDLAIDPGAVSISGAHYSETNDCEGTSVPPGGRCNINVALDAGSAAPGDPAAGSIGVASSAGGTMPVIAMVNPSPLLVDPLGIDLGHVGVGSSSASGKITLTNISSSSLPMPMLSVPAPFTIVDSTCVVPPPPAPPALLPGQSCAAEVVFSPTGAGFQWNLLTVTPVLTYVAVGGTGDASAGIPSATLSAGTLDFGDQLVGTASAAQSVTLTNTGTADLHVSQIQLGGSDAADFGEDDTCLNSPLAPNGSCVINVTFPPGSNRLESAIVQITDDAPDSPQSIALSGRGVGPGASVSPTNLAFGDQTVGTQSSPQIVTLTNTGSADLHITDVSITGTDAGEFSRTETCTAGMIAPSGSCAVDVVFAPTTTGSKAAFLVFTDDASGSPQSVGLSGTGIAVGATPQVALSPSHVDFGTLFLGTTKTVTVTVSNTGSANLVFGSQSFSLGGADPGQFSFRSPSLPKCNVNCTVPPPSCLATTTVLPTGSCQVDVVFAPTSAGSFSAALVLTDNAPDSPQSLPLTGTGSASAITVIPAQLDFGTVAVGGSSSEVLTVTNVSNQTIQFSLTLAGASSFGATQSSACTASGSTKKGSNGGLAPGTSCTVQVTFTPQAVGPASVVLTLQALYKKAPLGTAVMVQVSGNGA